MKHLYLLKRTPQRVMEDLFSLLTDLGTMAHLKQATTRALAAPVTDAQPNPSNLRRNGLA